MWTIRWAGQAGLGRQLRISFSGFPVPAAFYRPALVSRTRDQHRTHTYFLLLTDLNCVFQVKLYLGQTFPFYWVHWVGSGVQCVMSATQPWDGAAAGQLLPLHLVWATRPPVPARTPALQNKILSKKDTWKKSPPIYHYVIYYSFTCALNRNS